MVKLGVVKRECVATSIHITVRCIATTPIHFLNILKIAIQITNGTSGTTVVQTTYSTERKTVQGQEVKVHSNKVFKIDDTDGGDTESSTEEINTAKESTVKE